MSFVLLVKERDSDADFDVVMAFNADVLDNDEVDTEPGEESSALDYAEHHQEMWGQTTGEQLLIVEDIASVPSVLEDCPEVQKKLRKGNHFWAARCKNTGRKVARG